jgi:hypothetical protein
LLRRKSLRSTCRSRSGINSLLSNGFLETGLWAYSRHPNFFCEQAIWWVVYAFAVAADVGCWNVTLAGPVLLTLLFRGSANFTESITAGKYPAYAGLPAAGITAAALAAARARQLALFIKDHRLRPQVLACNPGDGE